MFFAGSDRAVLPSGTENGSVAQEAFDHSDVVQEALPYLIPSMFSRLHMLVKNSQLDTLREEELSD